MSISAQAPAVLRRGTFRASKGGVSGRLSVRQVTASAQSRASVAPSQASAETIESHLVSLVQNADYPNYLYVHANQTATTGKLTGVIHHFAQLHLLLPNP